MNWLHLFFSLDGRIARRQFWLGVCLIILFQTMIQLPAISRAGLDLAREAPPLWFRNLSLALDVACAWPLFAVLAKRQADRDQNPWLSFYFIALLLAFSTAEAFGLTQEGRQFTPVGYTVGLPLLGLMGVLIVELGMRRGTIGANRFGRDPLQG